MQPACNNEDIRLVGGSSPNEGRVELCYEGVWRTVCDTNWDRNSVLVVCRQLGLPTDSKLGDVLLATYNIICT